MIFSRGLTLLMTVGAAILATGCHYLNDDRIPHMPVNIDLSNPGIWQSYGVEGVGEFDEFIIGNGVVKPSGFPYTYNSATGYGGVLLIGGQDPFTGDVGPLAYDLSCPVERSPEVRVKVDLTNLDAVCPECGSHYNVITLGGAPVEGIAKDLGYGLTRYRCDRINGGYIIRD